MAFSWQLAEEYAVAHLRDVGFDDAHRDGSEPGALDVRGTDVVARVRFLPTRAGIQDVRRLNRCRTRGGAAVFYSLGGYTVTAEDFADQYRVALFSLNQHMDPTADNSHAHVLTEREGHLTAAQRQNTTRRVNRFHLRLMCWSDGFPEAHKAYSDAGRTDLVSKLESLGAERLEPLAEAFEPVQIEHDSLTGDDYDREFTYLDGLLHEAERQLHLLRDEAIEEVPHWFMSAHARLLTLASTDPAYANAVETR